MLHAIGEVPATHLAIKDWLAWCMAGTLAPRSVELYARYVKDFFFDTELDYQDVRLPDLIRWASEFDKYDASKYERRKAIRHFYRFCQLAGYVSLNPAEALPAKRPAVRMPEALTRDQLRSLWIAAHARGERQGFAIELLYLTGARCCEAAGVRREHDIVGERGARHLILREAKRGAGEEPRERSVPLEVEGFNRAGRVVDRLLEMGPASRANSSRDDHLLGVGKKTIWAWVKQAGRDCGLPDHLARPHRLRSTYATHLIEAGVDVTVVQSLLGHRKVETTMRYVQVRDERKLDALVRLGAYHEAHRQKGA